MLLDTLVCDKSFSLELQPTNRGLDTIMWDDGSSDTIRVVNQKTTYWVKHKEANNFCGYDVDSFIVRDDNRPIFVISVSGMQLSASSGYSNYQWYLDGVLITGATNRLYDVTRNGVYSVKARYPSGCWDSTSYQVTNVGIPSLPASGTISVHPTATQDKVYIEAGIPVNAAVVSMDGKILKQEYNVTEIDMSNFAEGIYLVHLTDGSGRILGTEKVTKIQ